MAPCSLLQQQLLGLGMQLPWQSDCCKSLGQHMTLLKACMRRCQQREAIGVRPALATWYDM